MPTYMLALLWKFGLFVHSDIYIYLQIRSLKSDGTREMKMLMILWGM